MEWIKWIVALPERKALIAVTIIAVLALWDRISEVEEKSEVSIEKNWVRHDNVTARCDSLLRSCKGDCDAQMAALRAENKQLSDQQFIILKQVLESNASIKKAEKVVDRAIITQKKSLAP
jgi:hypothetical protein